VTADRTKITEERTRSQLLTESLLRFPHASHECLGEFGSDLLSKSFGKTCEYSRYFQFRFCAIFIIVEPFVVSAF
jgi:hypothetical protein